ncbi:MAG: tetratricopeptide repeat protein [bacterium]
MTSSLASFRAIPGAACCVGLLLILTFTACSKKVVTTAPGRIQVEPRTIVHEVAPGETLALIADNYFGDPSRSHRIASDNGVSDPEQLLSGSILLLRFTEEEWQVAQRRAAAMKPYNRGVEFLEQERLEDAEREFGLALELVPDLVSAQYNQALVDLKRGRNEAAEQRLASLVALRPDDLDFLYSYGHVLFLEARFAEAVDIFAQLLGLDAQHRRGAFGWARSLQEAGRADEAILAWENYLTLDSSSRWANQARQNLQELRGE